MSSASVQPCAWPLRRWGLTVVAVFAGQLGLIFWLSDRTPIHARPAAGGPMLRLAERSSNEVLKLEDPTLFALPHRQGFAGQAWLTPTWTTNRSYSCPDEPTWLQLDSSELGAAFNRFVATNRLDALLVFAPPEPALAFPEFAPGAVAPRSSVLKIAGDLAERKLLSPVVLSSWPHPDLLTNSVVQLVADPEGRPVSLTLLSSSGSPKADQQALDLARNARFNPVEHGPKAGASAQGLSWGQLVFEWNTLPMPPTNATAGAAGSP